MPYYRFDMNRNGDKVHLTYKSGNEISLAGSKNGIIAKYLKHQIKPSDKTPFGWSILLAKEYNANGSSILVDIKPKESEFFFCEIDSIFGVCYDGWTAVLLRLKRLLPYALKSEVDEDDFEYDESSTEIIYSTMYLYGTFEDGELIGKWTHPRPSSVNGLLLWPDTITYFFKKIQEFDPGHLQEKIIEINQL